MCGIVGIVAKRPVSAHLIDGLQRLEYRGYDSAGLALINDDKKLVRKRCLGKVSQLNKLISNDNYQARIGIAHTRWATHGKPSVENAHPHLSGKTNKLAIVHNGIIENYQSLKTSLTQCGYKFTSETDSEVIAHLLEKELEITRGDTLLALQNCMAKFQGAYSLAVINCADNNSIYVCRQGSPLVIGLGKGENHIASDPFALESLTHKFIYLEEGDSARITANTVEIFNQKNKEVKRKTVEFKEKEKSTGKEKHKHFMLKEILEQPQALRDTINHLISTPETVSENLLGKNSQALLNTISNIQIAACGTSFNAGLVAKHWFESIANITCQVEVASEYRYRKKALVKNTLLICISQSGETADTLAALREENEKIISKLAICNVERSSMVREADLKLITQAGKEIGVASTKAFTTQLAALFMMVIAIAKEKGLSKKKASKYLKALSALPEQIEHTLTLDQEIYQLAEKIKNKNHTLFLARGILYPIAMEGALKLKEISYIHAEGYASGELKHGPLALVDSDMPVIFLNANNDITEKVNANIEEVIARGGEVLLINNEVANNNKLEKLHTLSIEQVDDFLTPFIFTIPMQLLAYHTAVLKGTDVDQPRNLAKSVTVE